VLLVTAQYSVFAELPSLNKLYAGMDTLTQVRAQMRLQTYYHWREHSSARTYPASQRRQPQQTLALTVVRSCTVCCNRACTSTSTRLSIACKQSTYAWGYP
jgi:hypothetical protein